MHYWLMKSEPQAFGIDTLKNSPAQTAHWDGVRNFQARNMMRDQMQRGDLAFFYHSNCSEPSIVGIMKIVREAYPDFTAFNPNDPHYDAKSDPDKPRWYMVDVEYVRHLKRFISLQELRRQSELNELIILRRGNRLSITPVSAQHWSAILKLEN